MKNIPFDRNLTLLPDQVDEPMPGIRRVMADNPSPFTFKGTVSYIIGRGRVAILDPGPNDPRHVEALLHTVRNETVTHIIVTHTHNDHSPAVPAIKAATGAKVYAEGPHRASRPLHEGDVIRPADRDFRPDVTVRDGEVIAGDGWSLEAVWTPGHTPNHMAFALKGTDILFSGDHVMGWSSTIVAPPDGSMRDYCTSLEKLMKRLEAVYFPGHGPAIKDAPRFAGLLLAHRRLREQSVLKCVSNGASTVADIVSVSYSRLDERLVPAARMTTLAHLEDLVARGAVETDAAPTLDAIYRAGNAAFAATAAASSRESR
jgi:glyoxylase-like metal-dependent hydrolase (beta-lactamase superfamily II)